MNTNVKEITQSKEWEEFLLAQDETPFFFFFFRGEVQQKAGANVLRLGLYENDTLIGIVQSILVKARRGSFYWVRHGPVLAHGNWQLADSFIEELKKRALEDGCAFIRIAPVVDDTDEYRKFFADRGFRPAPIHNMDAENAWVVDVDKSEEDLLKDMRKTTRYLVRKGEKIGINIVKTTEKKYFSDFMTLYAATAQRQHFVAHRGIEEEYELFGKHDLLQLFLAYYEDELLASAMILFYGKEAVYHHSGMKADKNDIPSSYLIQWEAIKEAKKRGMKRYNLWGIAPGENKNHPWHGLTIFKTGFGGRPSNHIHAQDLPLSSKYWFTWAVETIRRIRKGY